MSISQSAVANKLRLLRLPFEEQKIILENNLTERHARALIRIDRDDTRRACLGKIIDEKLNVSATESLVEEYLLEKEPVKKDAASPEKPTAASERSREKGLDSTVKSIRKRVDLWVNEGGNAEINVTNRASAVEIFVKLIK